MTVLQRRFHVASERSAELEQEMNAAYDVLHDTLSREQKKLLLRFLDAEHSFRDSEKLDAFYSGFRLADGVRTELGAPYSYEAEDEQRSLEQYRRETADE